MLPDAADHTQAAHSDTDCIGTDTKPEPPLWTRHTRLSPLWNTGSGPPARHVVASNTGCSASLPDLLPPRPQHGDAPAPLPSAPGSPRSTPHRGLLPLSICKPYCAGLSGSTSRQLFRGGNCHFLDWPPKHEDGPGAVPGVTPGLRRGGRWQGMLPGRGLPIPTGPPRPAARPSRLGSDAWAGQRASALSAPPSPPVPRRDDSNLERGSATAPSQAVWLPMPGDRETPVSKSDASERERGALPTSAGSGEWAWLPRKVGRLVSPSAADASPASRGPRVPCGASRGPAQCLVQGRAGR